jgi:hypothetical protein
MASSFWFFAAFCGRTLLYISRFFFISRIFRIFLKKSEKTVWGGPGAWAAGGSVLGSYPSLRGWFYGPVCGGEDVFGWAWLWGCEPAKASGGPGPRSAPYRCFGGFKNGSVRGWRGPSVSGIRLTPCRGGVGRRCRGLGTGTGRGGQAPAWGSDTGVWGQTLGNTRGLTPENTTI